MWHTRSAEKYRVSVGKQEESSFGDGSIIWILQRMSVEWINLAEERQMAGSCEHADVSSGCIKCS